MESHMLSPLIQAQSPEMIDLYFAQAFEKSQRRRSRLARLTRRF